MGGGGERAWRGLPHTALALAIASSLWARRTHPLECIGTRCVHFPNELVASRKVAVLVASRVLVGLLVDDSHISTSSYVVLENAYKMRFGDLRSQGSMNVA